MTPRPSPILENVRILGIANVDFDGVILWCNEEFARLQSDAPIHLVGKNVIQLTAADDRERARVNLANLGNGKVEYVIHEKRYASRAGELVNCRCQFLAVRDVPDPYILSLVYEWDPATPYIERINQLEQLLGEFVARSQKSSGVKISMTGNDNSQNATANNQSQATISNTTTNSTVKVAIISVVAVIAVFAIAVAAAIFVYVGLPKL